MEQISKTIDLFLDTNDSIEFTINAKFSIGNVISTFKLTEDEKNFIKRLETMKSPNISIEKEIGEQLYDLIFKDKILSYYEEIKRESIRESINLKLKFSKRATELLGFPWELLHDGNRFLVSSGKLNLIRSIEDSESSPINIKLPLRILIIVSRPLNVNQLDNLIEGEAVVKGFYSLALNNNVVINFLDPPTHDALIKTLADNEYHIVHFDGHGAFEQGNGYLVFENDFLEYELIDSETISNIFYTTNIKLIVLTACQSSTIGKNIFNSVAPALIEAGVPNVVAMQFPVPLNSAVKFAEHFYNSLSNSNSIVYAMTQGRKVIYRDNTWFIPTLYVSNNTDEIFINNNENVDFSQAQLQPNMLKNQYYEPHFVGRSEELIKISKAVSSTRTNCIIIWGSGGIGKTSLLRQYILRQYWRFTGEVIWIDLKGGKPLDKILTQICTNLNLNHTSENLKSEIYHYLESKNLLIVFDNFEDIENDDEILEFIRFIPRPTRTIITSRNDPLILNWKKIQLYKLNLEESLDLFFQLAESMDVIINESNIGSVNEICLEIDGHPLALTLIARMLLSNSIDGILAKIKNSTLKGIELALDISYNDLNELEQKMIQKLSVFDSYFDEEAIKFVSEIDNYDEVKDELIRCSFIHFDGEKFSLHPVIKQYVYNKITTKKKCHLKAAKYYQSKKYYFPMVDQLYYAEEWRDFAATMQQLISPLSLRGMPSLADALKRIDMLNDAVEKINDDKVKWMMDLDIAALYQQAGLFEKALEKIEKAYNFATEIDDIEGKCQSLAKKLQAYSFEGNAQTLDIIPEVESLIEDTDDEIVIINSVLCCADAYNILGIEEKNEDYTEKSIRRYKKAIKLLKAQNKSGEIYLLTSQAYNSLGQANLNLKNDETALKYLNKSLEIKKEIGDLYGASITLSALSHIYEKSGKLKEAKQYLNEIILISKKIQINNLLDRTYFRLAKISISLEEYVEVAEFLANAIIISLSYENDSTGTMMEEIENELIALSEKKGVPMPGLIIGFLLHILTDDESVKTLPLCISNKLPRIVQQIEEIPYKIDSHLS